MRVKTWYCMTLSTSLEAPRLSLSPWGSRLLRPISRGARWLKAVGHALFLPLLQNLLHVP